jgi:hypothetical protein
MHHRCRCAQTSTLLTHGSFRAVLRRDLYGNKLTGLIPSAIAKLTGLTFL